MGVCYKTITLVGKIDWQVIKIDTAIYKYVYIHIYVYARIKRARRARRIILRGCSTGLYHGIRLRGHITWSFTELYDGIILRNYIMGLYYRIILLDYITGLD